MKARASLETQSRTTEAKLLLIGIPVLIWTHAADLPPVPVRDLAQGVGVRGASSGPTIRRCATSRSCSGEKHHYLSHFWLQLWNSLLIAVAVGVLTLSSPPAPRLRSAGSRCAVAARS